MGLFESGYLPSLPIISAVDAITQCASVCFSPLSQLKDVHCIFLELSSRDSTYKYINREDTKPVYFGKILLFLIIYINWVKLPGAGGVHMLGHFHFDV